MRPHLPVNLVQPGSFLTLHYRLSGPDGADVVNTFSDKPATLSLGTGQLAPAMEQRLIGAIEAGGTKFVLALAREDGEVLARGRIDSVSGEVTFPQMCAFFRQASAEHGPIAAFGVGSFGLGMMAGALSRPHDGSEVLATMVGVAVVALGHDLNRRARG